MQSHLRLQSKSSLFNYCVQVKDFYLKQECASQSIQNKKKRIFFEYKLFKIIIAYLSTYRCLDVNQSNRPNIDEMKKNRIIIFLYDSTHCFINPTMLYRECCL